MRLLSFDIECSKVYKGYSPICNFGYVIYDENFDLIEKKDLIINPKAKFKLEGRKGRENIKLFYSEAEYNNAKPFSAFYKEIKKLLEYKNQIILNHAVVNDIIYLNNECKRYKFNIINYEAYDTVDVFNSLDNHKGSVSLKTMFNQLNNDMNFTPHKADDDAQAALLCFIESCKLVGLTPSEMIQAANLKPYSSTMENNKIINKNKKISDKHIRQISSLLNNKSVSFSIDIEKDITKYENIVYSVKQLGGKITRKVSEANIFIIGDNIDCKRYDSFIYNNEKGKKIRGCKYKEFMTMVQKELHESIVREFNSLG